jgi:putative flippase GtrA
MIDIFERYSKQTLKFLLVGGLGFIFNFIILKISIYFGVNIVLSEIIATLFALQLTFLLHDNWTYKLHKKKSHHYNNSIRYIGFITSNSIGSILTIILFSIYLSHFIALALAAMISMAWSFFMNKMLIWKNKHIDISYKYYNIVIVYIRLHDMLT